MDLSSISFFDLGVVLGRYKTWQDCRDALGDRFIAKRGRLGNIVAHSAIVD